MFKAQSPVGLVSLSARRAWIEIKKNPLRMKLLTSLSARRAWIEICDGARKQERGGVALRKESVDRNGSVPRLQRGHAAVALRKESMECFSF